jgi:SOS response regulatory protein OraA/RecX
MTTSHRDETKFWTSDNCEYRKVIRFVDSTDYAEQVARAVSQTRPHSRASALSHLNEKLLPDACILHEALEKLPNAESYVYARVLALYVLTTQYHVSLLTFITGATWKTAIALKSVYPGVRL